MIGSLIPRAAVASIWSLLASAGSLDAGQPQGLAAADVAERRQAPVLTRDADGRVTIRATRVSEALVFDGRIDEPVYASVSPAGAFVQQLPVAGAPATQRTDVWILYDQTHLYVSARCWDSAPPSDWVADELRRDDAQIGQNDTFGVLLDTFHDRRNGVLFFTNPLGALADQQITDERASNADWNPVWDVKTDRTADGWTVEMQIPFKSLRYGPGARQIWGIQLRRVVRRLNEWSFISPVPISASGQGSTQGIARVSAAATLVGLEVPQGRKDLEIKPYGTFGATADPAADPPRPNEVNGDLGVDVKYGVTQNLTADFTYNTDFAQVEVDNQQVNLTRFNLFFPEKREFFLESRGIFDFGLTGGFQGSTPSVFYSRRIGLEDGSRVPLLGGARLTGKAGKYSIGALSIQTDETAAASATATNFTVVRIKRDLFRRSSIGGVFTERSRSTVVEGSNQVYGLDARLAFFDDVNFNGYVAKTATPGLDGRDMSYQARFTYPSDRYKAIVEHLLVERHFNPEVGFLRRENFRRSFAEFGFTPRPTAIRAIRQLIFEVNLDYTVTADTGELETRSGLFSFEIERENSDRFEFDIVDTHERVDEAFDVSGGLVAPGEYDFRHAEVAYRFGAQRPVSGSVFLRRGSFYGGDITVLELDNGRLKLSDRLSVEPSLSLNWLNLPSGSFQTSLLRGRASYSLSSRSYVSGLLQYNTESHAFSTNLRFRWEYRPGSEVFLVLTEERDIERVRVAGLRNRGLVLKVNRLFQF